MPGWLEKLLVSILTALVDRLTGAAQDAIIDMTISAKAERRKKSRAKIITELLKAEELDDDAIIDLHRRLRDVDAD